MSAGVFVLFAAILAVAAYFCAGHCDFDGAVLFNLFF
jgi:hypothetical protein